MMEQENDSQLFPEEFARFSPGTKMLVTEYLNGLNDKERKAYIIAKKHLGTSFNIVKSNGYINFCKSKNR